MKHLIAPMAGLAAAIGLSGCAGAFADPVALAQAVRVLNEGCERTVDVSLDKAQPGGGSLRATRVCAPPASQPPPAPKP